MNKKIMVYGLGYVGLSNAVLLAQNNEVVGIEILEKKVFALKEEKSSVESENEL
jgi:UDPglucose 6-dehydrogenase